MMEDAKAFEEYLAMDEYNRLAVELGLKVNEIYEQGFKDCLDRLSEMQQNKDVPLRQMSENQIDYVLGKVKDIMRLIMGR